MPYIKPENRPKMNKVIEVLYSCNLFGREIIFILFEYCTRYIRPSYNNYKNFCGELRQCATEIERRMECVEFSIVNEDVNCSISFGRRSINETKIRFMKESNIEINGDLNYILYAYCERHIKTSYPTLYNKRQCSSFAKKLRLCAKKIEREILAPYEELKIIENGDIK